MYWISTVLSCCSTLYNTKMLYGLYEQELAPSDYFILQKYTDTWSVRYKDIGRVIHSYKQMIKCQNDQ